MERSVLGKGLEALIPKKTKSLEKKGELLYLEITSIKTGKFQPRESITNEELMELKESIKKNGILQPIIVRETSPGKFEVIAGHRRLLAANLLKMNKIPAIIKNVNDTEAFAMAVIENLQRKNLNPIEEALAFRKLLQEFKLSLEDISNLVGKNKSYVANSLRLLNLPDEIKEALKKDEITYTQARTLLALKDEDQQRKLFQELIRNKLSVRELETRVGIIKKAKKKDTDPFVLDLEGKLQQKLGTKVRLYVKKNNQGKIVIEFYTLDDLNRIIRRL